MDTTTTTAPAAEQQAPVSFAVTPDQAKQLAQWEVERGRLTQSEADAMLAADGIAQPTAPAEGAQSPEAAELDSAFPPAAPHEYAFPYGPGELTPEQHKADAMLRGWLSDAQFPRELGSSLAKQADAVAKQWETMSPVARQLHAKSERLKLEKSYGAEFQRKVDMAERFIADLDQKRPGLSRMLTATGLAHDARVVAAIIAQAERVAMRKR